MQSTGLQQQGTFFCSSLLAMLFSLLASPSGYKIHGIGLNISEETLSELCQPNILQVSSSLFRGTNLGVAQK